MRNKYLIVLFFVLSLTSCEWFENGDPECDDCPEYSSGDADFTTYVAIGNSLTAGFMNGDLYKDGQWRSYPQRLSGQMAKAGGGAFAQPLMYDNYGFGKRILLDIQNTTVSLYDGPVDNRNYNNIADQGPFNNMGVPGAKVGDLLVPTLSNDRANSYYERFAADYGTSTIMDEVMAQNPTFVTLWIGANDAMGYALRGGDITGEPEEAITTETEFRTKFQSVVDRLGDTPGIVGNLPDISVIPYFSMNEVLKLFYGIDMYHIQLTTEQAQTANEAIAKAEADLLANHGITHSYGITFVAGNNAVLVFDPESTLPAPYNFRQAIDTDDFVLQLLADVEELETEVTDNGYGWVATDGTIRPIEHKYVLDATEKAEVSAAIATYNTIIADIVNQEPNLYLADLSARMDELKDGIEIDMSGQKVTFTTDYLSGSFFSYDGVHPTPEGAGIICNEFIEAINTNFNAEVPAFNITFSKKKAVQ